MTNILPSYIAGDWAIGSGAGVRVRDAVTGDELPSVSSLGLDLGEAVAHARGVGGPALRSLTFVQRAGILKDLGLALSERKDELYALSARAGATRADAAIDVDGGFGTALVYASLGRKGLPDAKVLVEDDAVPLGKTGQFLGRHILSPRRGLALQINAFNFPVWGFLEKLAPALLAGVPTIVKPATPTAFIAEHAVRIIVEAGVLPDGALQLVCGSLPGVFDLLGGQDTISFTGSAGTAARLRSDPAITQRSVRFNAEADSLNSSVLGPDAGPGSDTFGLYVAQLVTEMTTKAGQKCTAIRRAFVPRAQLEAVAEAVVAKLGEVVVGAPGADGVTMGSLVGLEQRDDVRGQLARLTEQARILWGDPVKVDVIGADAERGAFMSPVLLEADAAASAAHEVEAFGPVSTLLGYDGVDDLAVAIARGEGSLAGSVVSEDEDFVRDVLSEIAPYHGRLLVLDRGSAAESTGHGIPMPQLVHGGPGRAGGGEEEGGLRAVTHHLQRTAIQGGARVIAAFEERARQ